MPDETDEFNAEVAARQLTEQKTTKIGRTITVAGLNLVPVVGGTLATLLQEILPDWKCKRIHEFLGQFGRDHEKIKDKLNQAAFTTAEHGLLIESIVRKVTQTSEKDKEKLRAFRAVMVNSSASSPPEKMEQDMFLGWVDRLQEIHIIVVSFFRDPDNFAARYGFTRSQYRGTGFVALSQDLQQIAISEELLRAALLELDRLGILPGAAQTLSAMSGRPVDLTGLFSGLGRKFADFIALPAKLHDTACEQSGSAK